MKCIEMYKKKRPALANRLPSYNPLNVLFRFAIISLIAIADLHLIVGVVATPEEAQQPIPIVFYITIIFSFIAATEIQILMDNILERFIPVPEKIKARITLQIIFGFAVLVVAHRVAMNILDPELIREDSRTGVFLGLITGLFFVWMIATSITVARFTQKWMDSQEQIAEMKRERLEMSYNSLQDQLNPHFLFNNLSVLKSLIIYDPDSAVTFTEHFTDVYRYVLQSKDKRLVKLRDELEFMGAYKALHEERLGEGLDADGSFEEEYLDKEIAPLTLQLLFENAVKHNIASRSNPLKLRAYVKDGYVVVTNSLNRRTASYSTKTGLKNLIKRYEMLTEKKIVVQYDDDTFEVRVPLL